MNHTMSLKDVARTLGVKSFRIQYVYVHGLVPEPAHRISGRRIFEPTDLALLAKHFGVSLGGEAAAEPQAAATIETVAI